MDHGRVTRTAVPSGPPRFILVVEDNPADQRLVREALADRSAEFGIEFAADGVEALARLRAVPPRRPSLVLLDLSLPRKGGREVLAEIRRDPRLRDLPVIVMTSSPSETGLVGPASGGADDLLRKPSSYAEYQEAVRRMLRFASPVPPGERTEDRTTP